MTGIALPRYEVDDWVIYDNGFDPAEDGTVTAVISESMVRVLYRGDTTAKATSVFDLRPGRSRTCAHRKDDRGLTCTLPEHPETPRGHVYETGSWVTDRHDDHSGGEH